MNVQILTTLSILFGVTSVIGYECGENITASEGELTSPGFPSNYSHDMSCMSTIESTGHITVLFTHMAIDCSDKLQIIDGDTDMMLAELCGVDLRYHMTETSKIKIRFHTDETSSDSGWRFVWYYVRSVITRTIDPDVRSSTEFAHNITNLVTASLLTGADGKADLNIETIEMGSGYDRVIFFEEPSGREIGSYGQNYSNYITSETGSISIWFTFDSDSTNHAKCKLRWPADECLTNSHNSPTGVITSHGYPDIYYGRRDYRWCINSPTGKGINIHITDMNLQNPGCTDEYVEVIDREGNSTLLKHCENKPIYLRTNSTFVVIIFHTSPFDGEHVGGWRLEWDDNDETTTTSSTQPTSTTMTTTPTTTAATSTTTSTASTTTTTIPTTTTTTPTTTTTAPTTTTITPTTTATGFSPRPPSKYNDTPCETSTRFYGVCQYNNLECLNGTYTDRLCRRPVNQGQITSNVGEVYRSCCITGSSSGYSAKQTV